ncbi:MAG: protein-L-isoaspartate(D-aspartate) O-methyltransferase [Actinobacteria bacterium]|nr:protein-L-isoaspartate(D-aspartate) O-methyltransferase [Actinomycetota bacterium]MBL7123490.1 protein-L-isoaspartate(D-aspartate) O-methyltransferase [Actinomycetota bacterium]
MFKKFRKNQIIFAATILITLVAFLANLSLISCNNIEKNTDETDKYIELRNNMVDYQIIARGITDKKVIDTMRKVPRHEFVDQYLKDSAYEDRPLSIGMGQTISQPYIVALMTESLELTGNERVLEIGTGSGYQAAILSEIVKEVYTVEIITVLHQKSNIVLSEYPNVKTSNHDGYYGWEEYAPFDRIIVTAAPDHIPQPLVEQLADGGIMVIPVGLPGWNQVLWKVEKKYGEVTITRITDVVFVPLTREIK